MKIYEETTTAPPATPQTQAQKRIQDRQFNSSYVLNTDSYFVVYVLDEWQKGHGNYCFSYMACFLNPKQIGAQCWIMEQKQKLNPPGILHIAFFFCICYNASRQNDVRSPYWTTMKSPGVAALGLFYSFLVRRLNPQAGYRMKNHLH